MPQNCLVSTKTRILPAWVWVREDIIQRGTSIHVHLSRSFLNLKNRKKQLHDLGREHFEVNFSSQWSHPVHTPTAKRSKMRDRTSFPNICRTEHWRNWYLTDFALGNGQKVWGFILCSFEVSKVQQEPVFSVYFLIDPRFTRVKPCALNMWHLVLRAHWVQSGSDSIFFQERRDQKKMSFRVFLLGNVFFRWSLRLWQFSGLCKSRTFVCDCTPGLPTEREGTFFVCTILNRGAGPRPVQPDSPNQPLTCGTSCEPHQPDPDMWNWTSATKSAELDLTSHMVRLCWFACCPVVLDQCNQTGGCPVVLVWFHWTSATTLVQPGLTQPDQLIQFHWFSFISPVLPVLFFWCFSTGPVLLV